MQFGWNRGSRALQLPAWNLFDRRKSPMELYVADRGNRRVQIFDSEGGYLRTFGESFLTSPDCFAIDGDTVVIPELLGRVTVVDADDGLLYHLGENERTGKDKDPEWPNITRSFQVSSTAPTVPQWMLTATSLSSNGA